MADLMDKISAERRWQIATNKLSGAHVACAAALKGQAGEEVYNEFCKVLWYQGGMEIDDFLNNAPIDTGNAIGLLEAINLQFRIFLGAECDVEVVEATEDKSVTKVTKCAWHERWKEMGLTWDLCSAGHQSMGDGAVKKLNPDFAFKLTKNMVCGDQNCEFVIERKK